MATFPTMPFVQRLCYSLVSGALILIALYLGQHIIIPIAFACLFSIILIAPCDRMEKAGINRGLSATIALDEIISAYKKQKPSLASRLNYQIFN